MKRSSAKELMDEPGQPAELLVEDLRNLRIINRYLGSYRNVLRGVARLVDEQKMRRFSLLDVGTGSGDIPAAIARWARRRGIGVELVALEPEPVTAQAALNQTRQFPEITVVRGDGRTPPFRPASFDFVLSSQLLHHFPDEVVIAMLKNWSGLARKAIIISDLVRHPVAYHGIRLLTKLFTRNVMTRTDAPLSVQRAMTLAEWRHVVGHADVGKAYVVSAFPFRVLALVSRPG